MTQARDKKQKRNTPQLRRNANGETYLKLKRQMGRHGGNGGRQILSLEDAKTRDGPKNIRPPNVTGAAQDVQETPLPVGKIKKRGI